MRDTTRHSLSATGTVGLTALLIAGCSSSPPPATQPAPDIQTEPAAERTPAQQVPREAMLEPVAPAPVTPAVDVDTVVAGRFDNGKMWTFEYPPLDYFRETYGFEPDSNWFLRARLGALRLPNCSASFVSPSGLVMTNHHCARESVSAVSEPGEELLDNGFYAKTLEEERFVEDFHADLLIDIVDVTDEVDAALESRPPGEDLTTARDAVHEQIVTRLTAEHGGEDAEIVVEVIALWNGAKTSAYVFRRYTNIRLVMAPELQMGYYGGDADNFTYPRYALDMSFFRVYDENDQPLTPEHYFRWSERGVEEGDPVFIIGNPGSTSRLQTVAELEFRAEVGEKAILDFVTTRAEALQTYYDQDPETAESLDVRNEVFSLLNARKSYTGMWKGLLDRATLARRAAAERAFRNAIESKPALQEEYSGLFDQMAEIQAQKLELGDQYAAFLALGNPDYTAAVLFRGIFAFQYLASQSGGAPADVLADIRTGFKEIGDQPAAMQTQLLAARLADIDRHLGDSPIARQVLAGRSPEDAAKAIIAQSALADSTLAAQALDGSTLSMNDPAVQAGAAILQGYGAFQGAFSNLTEREQSIARALGRARFDVYGLSVPPDATFSLRIADGFVTGYEYNGTLASPYTTFFGLYDRFYSHGSDSDWTLPSRWQTPPSSFDLSTPFNFVSTADIIGGNSGSPVINQDLEIVGLVFDGNIESLPGDYIYVSDYNRAVAVDARGILEALDEIYDADRLVLELTTGQLASSEEEADRRRN